MIVFNANTYTIDSNPPLETVEALIMAIDQKITSAQIPIKIMAEDYDVTVYGEDAKWCALLYYPKDTLKDAQITYNEEDDTITSPFYSYAHRNLIEKEKAYAALSDLLLNGFCEVRSPVKWHAY